MGWRSHSPAAAYPLATVAQALVTLQGAGLAVWLVGLEWRPPRGPARLRRVRQLLPGDGDWEAAREAFCTAWRDQHRRRSKAPTAKDCGNLRGND